MLVITTGLLTACSAKNEDVDDNSNITVTERDYNYLTGQKLSSTASKTARPIAVMINNAKAALPQSGLTSADIIYEMVTEGGITRLMALYSDIETMGKVGPVRSARDQFIEFLLPLNAIYVHIGSSIYAKDMLNWYYYQDIDGIYLGNTAFVFDTELNKLKSSEHCWYTTSELVKAGIAQTGIQINDNIYPAFEFVGYNEEPRSITTGDANTISFSFSNYADVQLIYEPSINKYQKLAFGAPHIDADTNQQLAFENVITLFTDIGLKPDTVCSDFELSEGGKGYYFYGGKYEEIYWEKGDPEDPLIITDKKGNALPINVGKTYVAVIGNDMLDTFNISAEVSSVTSVERVQ